MEGGALFLPFAGIIRIVKGFQLGAHIQIELDLALFKGVELLHISVYDHFRRTDFLQSGIGAQKRMFGILRVKDTSADQQAQKQDACVHQAVRRPVRLIIFPVKAEIKCQKEKGQNGSHKGEAHPADSKRLPGVQSHRQKKYRLFQPVRKIDSKP